MNARDAARDQACTLRLPGACLWPRTDTTVLAHSNSLADGKGMALKASDGRAAFACYGCHAILDGQTRRPDHLTQADVLRAFLVGVGATQRMLETMEATR